MKISQLILLGALLPILNSCTSSAPTEDELWISSLSTKRGPAQNVEPLRICYISLNNPKEFTITKDFVDGLHRSLGLEVGSRVIVEEFQEQGASPEKSFQAMFNSGKKCDGLVISGHHTGAFGGNRASGSLDVNYLAQKSCAPRTKEFFDGIHALWLQGCRTLGAADTSTGNQNLAEFHGARVNQVREEDGLTQNRLQLEDEFSSLLDTESPYSLRFLKVFPVAKLFGWTKVAPGEKSESENSIAFHIANLARRERLEKKAGVSDLQYPLQNNLSKASAAAYMRSLMTILTPAKDKKVVQNELGAWKDQGRATDTKKKLWGFSNPDLNALEPLLFGTNKLAIEARSLSCEMKSAFRGTDKLKALSQVLGNESYISYSFYDLMAFYKDERVDPVIGPRLAQAFRTSRALQNFLERKLKSPNVGLTRKIDYLSIGRMAGISKLESLFQDVETRALGFLNSPIKPGTPDAEIVDLLDNKITLIRSLISGRTFTMERWKTILSGEVDASFQTALVRTLQSSGSEAEDTGDDFGAEEFFGIVMHAIRNPEDRAELIVGLRTLPVSADYRTQWMYELNNMWKKSKDSGRLPLIVLNSLIDGGPMYKWAPQALRETEAIVRFNLGRSDNEFMFGLMGQQLSAMVHQRVPSKDVEVVAGIYALAAKEMIKQEPRLVDLVSFFVTPMFVTPEYEKALCGVMIPQLNQVMPGHENPIMAFYQAYCGQPQNLTAFWSQLPLSLQITMMSHFFTLPTVQLKGVTANILPPELIQQTVLNASVDNALFMQSLNAYNGLRFSKDQNTVLLDKLVERPESEDFQNEVLMGSLVNRSNWSFEKRQAYFVKLKQRAFEDEYGSFLLDLMVLEDPKLPVDAKKYVEEVLKQEPVNPMRRLVMAVLVENLNYKPEELKMLRKRIVANVSFNEVGLDIGLGMKPLFRDYFKTAGPKSYVRGIETLAQEASLRPALKVKLKKLVSASSELNSWEKQALIRVISNPSQKYINPADFR